MNRKFYLGFAIIAVVLIAGLHVRATHNRAVEPQKPKHDMSSMNERGDRVMGFDHLKTTHHFLLKQDGGVIQIEANEASDQESRDQIRQHLGHIAKMFSDGNFSAPMLIHEQNPPGTSDMKRLKGEIKYEFVERERGAAIQISTANPDALKAIHEFLRFQIKEHETGDPLEVK